MASMISRRFSYRLLTSSPSSSLYSQSRPSNTIAKSTSQFQPSGTPKSLHLCLGSTPSCTESNTNSFSLSSDENPRNVWSSRNGLFGQKPKILDLSFVRSAPIVTSRTPSSSLVTKARFFSANGPSSKSENPEIEGLLEEMIKNINGLKNALALLGAAQIGFGAYNFPLPPIVFIQCSLAFAFPVCAVDNMRSSLRRMHYLKTGMEENLLLILGEVCSVATVIIQQSLVLGVVQLGLGVWNAYITRSTTLGLGVSVQSMLAVVSPFLLYFQLLRQLLEQKRLNQKMERQGERMSQIMRPEDLKFMNLFLVRLRRASFCVAGLSGGLLLYLVLRNTSYVYQIMVNL